MDVSHGPHPSEKPYLIGDSKQIQLASDLVIADRALAGVHPGYRPSEAKGSQWSATFTPTRAASQLSRAPHFKSQVNATVRLSDVSGKPHISDADAKSPAKAVSVRFHAPDGAPLQADVITRSVDAFPVRTPAEYLETLRALKAGGAVKAAYFKAHPFVEQYLKQKIYIPSSYVRATYYFANAVVLVAANGTRTTVRYRIVPTAAEAAESTPATIEPAAAARLGPSFLEDEIAERIAPGGKGAEFVLVAQIAAPGDLVDDCTKIWPADRPIVELGTVKLEEYLDQDAPAQERIIYNPWPNVDGVEPSNDPLLFARNDIYQISGNIRRRELQVGGYGSNLGLSPGDEFAAAVTEAEESQKGL